MLRKILKRLRDEKPAELVSQPEKRISPLLWRDCPGCGNSCCGEHKGMLYIGIGCKCGYRFTARNEYYNEIHPDTPYYD